MSVAPMKTGPSVVANGAAAALYTSPVNTATTISRASVVNVTGGAVTLKLWLVRSGGAVANATLIYGAAAAGQTIQAGPSEPIIVNAAAGLVLAAGDALWGLCDTASALNFTASGWTQ